MLRFFRLIGTVCVSSIVFSINHSAFADDCVTEEDLAKVYGNANLENILKDAYKTRYTEDDPGGSNQILLDALQKGGFTKFGERTLLDQLASFYFEDSRKDKAIEILNKIKDENLLYFENEEAVIAARINDYGQTKTYKRAQPLVRLPPYPKGVKRSAHCWFTFDVSSTGAVENIEDLYCTDKKLRKYAKKSIAAYKYRPAIENGKPIKDTGFTTKIRYRLMDECGTIIPEIKVK